MKLHSLFVAAGLLFAFGCSRQPEITDLQRKEAANLVSEAQFAVTLRDYARAEPLLEKAAKLAPDTGDYWISLGMARKRLGNASGAKSAYEEAHDAFAAAYKKDPKNVEPLLQSFYVLALLGRADDARSALEKALKKEPDNRALRRFSEDQQLDRITKDPGFKEISL